jgi:hypothetical protein
MRTDPVLEWRRLTEHYRQMSDGELRELAAYFDDLTETAQQTLRTELRSRGFVDPQTSATSTSTSQSAFILPSAPPPVFESGADSLGGHLAHAPELVPDVPDTQNEDSSAHDYTWKTPLCNCDSREEVMQLQETLRRAGIESWVNFDGYTTSFAPSIQGRFTVGSMQILVAADQLDHAREIAAQPIPQDIVEASKIQVPEFVAPKCPKCRAADSVLIDVNPTNTWRCEQCDAEWTESSERGAGDTPGPEDNAS